MSRKSRKPRKFHPAGVAMVVLEDCKIEAPAVRQVLTVLALHANPDFETRPGNDRIRELTRLSRTAVKNAIRTLLETGWITVVEESNGRGNAMKYRIKGSLSVPFIKPTEQERGHKRGHSRPQKGSLSGPQHIEHDNKARACARERSSDSLLRGLDALAALDPDAAKLWGQRILDANIEGGVLYVTTHGSHAAHVLRTDHAEDLRRAFAPANGNGRVIVEAKEP